jgi:hypothetical protein
MAYAKEVVIIGCSAGGLGIFLGLDQMVRQIKSAAAAVGNMKVKVHGLADSGFFMEHSSDFPSQLTHRPFGKDEAVTARTIARTGTTNMDYAMAMRDLFSYANMGAGAHPACLLQHGGGSSGVNVNVDGKRKLQTSGDSASASASVTDCVFAANLAPHIKTPLFLIQPRFDSWQILHIYTQNYTAAGVNAYGARLVNALQQALLYPGNPGHGVFVDSCSHHCTSCSTSTENTWSGKNVLSTSSYSGNSGTSLTVADAFSRWYNHMLEARPPTAGASPSPPTTPAAAAAQPPVLDKYSWFIQDRPYPCSDCCMCSVDVRAQLRREYR